MHRRSTLFALLLCLVLVPCRGNAADLAEDQEALRPLAGPIPDGRSNKMRLRFESHFSMLMPSKVLPGKVGSKS